MRCSLSMCALLAITLIAVLALCGAASSSGSGSRGKPRTIRGFKNVALSTARGFGKRDGSADLLEQASPLDRYTESLPVEWFVEEMRSNPELARIIVHKFVDADQDGELTAEELLRPVY